MSSPSQTSSPPPPPSPPSTAATPPPPATPAAHTLYEFLLPVASTIDRPRPSSSTSPPSTAGSPSLLRRNPHHQHQTSASPYIHLVSDAAREALHHARASIVASGTATVQAALVGNPFVVVYRVSALTFKLAKSLVWYPPESPRPPKTQTVTATSPSPCPTSSPAAASSPSSSSPNFNRLYGRRSPHPPPRRHPHPRRARSPTSPRSATASPLPGPTSTRSFSDRPRRRNAVLSFFPHFPFRKTTAEEPASQTTTNFTAPLTSCLIPLTCTRSPAISISAHLHVSSATTSAFAVCRLAHSSAKFRV